MPSVRYLTFFAIILLTSCASYRQNIMFKASEQAKPEIFQREATGAEKNYVIQKNDLLTINVFSNKGERIIDPNPELTNSNLANMNNQQVQQFNYLVELNGVVKFPVIGEVKVDGLTLRQAEEITQKEYAKYFKEPFTVINFVNKRVTVLGAPGGLVIPLTNQNVTVVEVLAMARGLSNDSKADNIKLIRNEHIYQLDFSTIDSYRKSNMLVEP
ncbi:MAG: polysaccharide biosynthesis/export family protein, partial [Flammeovirgaceae bacterium]